MLLSFTCSFLEPFEFSESTVYYSVKIYLSEAVLRYLWVTSFSLLHYYCHLVLRWCGLKEIIEVLILHVNLYMGLFGRSPCGRMPAESGSEWPKDDIKAAAPPCVLKRKNVPRRFQDKCDSCFYILKFLNPFYYIHFIHPLDLWFLKLRGEKIPTFSLSQSVFR